MNTHPAPTAEGHYWAKLITPTEMPPDEDWASTDWEVVTVYDSNGTGDEKWAVAVPGIAPSQWIKNFEWGPRIDMSSKPGATPRQITTTELGLPANGVDLNKWIDSEIDRHLETRGADKSNYIAVEYAAHIARGAALQVIADHTTLIANLRRVGYVVLDPHPFKRTTNFDLFTHLVRQRQWSERTFGPGDRAMGVVDHIRKELNEIEADPGDLKEWIDVVILGLDGAWRSGASPQEIIDALVAKHEKNEARTWPDWRTADPNKAIEHDRSHD